jgi:putative ABC transport system ATP-binding protein
MSNIIKSPFLEARNVTKFVNTVTKPLQILSNINLTMDLGSSLAILGPSGCGKSTLLGILAGLDTPSSGDVLWSDRVISDLDEEKRAELRKGNLGFVFQSFQLLSHLNAYENVLLPLELIGRNNPEKIATEMLELVGLKDRAEHFPKTLSGGEQQRVALARAFSIKPKILFADEPTGSLDHANGDIVKDLLFNFQESNNTTLVIVTHDSELAEMCNFKMLLRAGRIVDIK